MSNQNEQAGVFVLPLQKAGEPGHTLVFAPSAKGKSIMPDNNELTVGLVEQAFKMIGRDDFQVSAQLSVDDPAGLRAYGLFQSILLMAYREGQASVADKACD